MPAATRARRTRRLPPEVRRARIIEAAVRCFARRGFAGTTTRRLAQAAGVSEALVFRHFPDKRALYRAIVEAKLAGRPPGLFPEEAAARGDDRAVLESVAGTLLRRVDQDPDFLRLLVFSGLEGNPLSRMFFEERGRSVLDFLKGHLERRMGEGAIRRGDAQVLARAFLGMVMHHLHLKHILGLPVANVAEATLVAAWAGIFLEGVRA